MAVETSNPEGLVKPAHYSQIGIAKASRTAYLSGQVAFNAEGRLIGPGDLMLQTEQAYRNVGAAVKSLGATFQDIAKLTVYVVGWTPDKMQQLVAGAMAAGEDIGFDVQRPITLIGVAALSDPELLIEVEAIVALD